jgi:MFS transporter, DHA1 family, multidrug resistance protein
MVLFSVTVFLELTTWGHVMAFTPLYLENELGVPPDEVPRWAGLLAASSLAVAAPLSPFWGVLADRFSRKAVIVRAQMVEAVAYALLAMSTEVWQFLAIRLLLGLSFGNIAVVIATQSMVTPANRAGTAIGVVQMSSTMAISVGPLVGSLLINTLGMRAMWALDSALALVAALLTLFVFREPNVHDRTTSIVNKLKLVFGQVARVPPIRWNFLCWFLIFSATGAMDPFLPVLIGRLSGDLDPATLIGVLLAAYGILTGIGTPLAGWLADRLGPVRMFLVATTALAMIASGMGFATTLPFLALLVILRAAPQSSTNVVLYSHLAAHTPVEHRTAVMSLTPMPRNLAWFIAPLLASVVSGFGLPAVFWLAGGLYVAATLSAILMARASPSGTTG